MNKLKNIWNKVRSVKNIELYLALVISAIVIVVIFVSLGTKENISESSSDKSYINQMEHKISNVVQSMEGCGNATVAISYKSADEKVYAYESKTDANGEIKNSLVLVKGEPLVLKTLTPNIIGVVVVAEGAENPIVRLKIIEVVVTLLDVDASNVQVFTYKN